MKNTVLKRADILLPAAGIDPRKWAVVAVDQYTSQPEYWREVENIVGDAPSTLRLVLPEAYLTGDGGADISQMQANMRAYRTDGTLEERVRGGYILVERRTQSGTRLGLMVCLDLEAYDYAPGSQSLIRATEGTVLERVPPRVRLRRGAALELPHILMLLDDKDCRVIEPLWEARGTLEKLYDFDLMQDGGHLIGWKVDGAAAERAEDALDRLYESCDGLFLAVGDGNHSLAAARARWLEIRDGVPEAQREHHPARYALAEIENLNCPAIRFAPIHRLATGVDARELAAACVRSLSAPDGDAGEIALVCAGEEQTLRCAGGLGALQAFLDRYMAEHPGAKLDYIHGDETLRQLADRPDAVGFMPRALEKGELFPYIRHHGPLPRKSFSMGQANEKRFYFEARALE